MERRRCGEFRGQKHSHRLILQASPATWFLLEDPSNPTLKEKVKEFVQKFDKNKDGRIEMSEVTPE